MGAAASAHAQPERDRATRTGPRKKRPADKSLDHERKKLKSRKFGQLATCLEPRGYSTDSPIAIDSDDEPGPREPNEAIQSSKRNSTKGSQKQQGVFRTMFSSHLERLLPSDPIAKATENGVNFPSRSAHPVNSNDDVPKPTSAVPKATGRQSSGGRPMYNSLDYCDPDDVGLTLLDIPDFDIRSKVAQLMAISPASSVSDLYHLLIMKKGKLKAAKKQIMPKDQIQSTMPSLGQKRSTNPQITSTSPTEQLTIQPTRSVEPKAKTAHNPASGRTDDSDDVMIKIDWDDPELIWDNDVPDLPLPVTKSKKKPMKKGSRSKKEIPPTNQLGTKKTSLPKSQPPQAKPSINQPISTRDITPPEPSKLPFPRDPLLPRAASPEVILYKPPSNTQIPKLPRFPPPERRRSRAPSPQVVLYKPPPSTQTSQRANTSAKRTTQTTSRFNIRENSSDREFLVPDEYIVIDSDYSYIDSDAVESDDGSDDEDKINDSEVKVLVRLRKEYGPSSVVAEDEGVASSGEESGVSPRSAPTMSGPASRNLDRVMAEMERRAKISRS